jgi:hypothetical protein
MKRQGVVMKAKRICGYAAAMLILLMIASPVLAQRVPGVRGARTEKAFNQRALDANLFPPELVMRHQQELELTKEQVREILKASQEAQSQILEEQWELSSSMQTLREELKNTRVDEEIVLSHLRQIMAKEANVKEIQVRLLIRVKNLLTAEQQDTARKIRASRRKVETP